MKEKRKGREEKKKRVLGLEFSPTWRSRGSGSRTESSCVYSTATMPRSLSVIDNPFISGPQFAFFFFLAHSPVSDYRSSMISTLAKISDFRLALRKKHSCGFVVNLRRGKGTGMACWVRPVYMKSLFTAKCRSVLNMNASELGNRCLCLSREHAITKPCPTGFFGFWGSIFGPPFVFGMMLN